MHILINKVFQGFRYDTETNIVVPSKNDENYVIAPIVVKAEDIVRIYTELPNSTNLVFNLYNRKHNTYDNAIEKYKTRRELLKRLSDLETMLNEK